MLSFRKTAVSLLVFIFSLSTGCVLQTKTTNNNNSGVTMPTSESTGFLAMPPSGTGKGVLVLHAWWGLNENMKAICTRLAEAGFVAYAPDLYRGQIADNIADAENLMKNMDGQEALMEVQKAAIYLGEKSGMDEEGIAVIGFSLGASFALDLAAADFTSLRSVILYYGSGEGDFSKSKADFLGHFAEHDVFEETKYIVALEQTIRDAGRPVTFHTYPGTGHWFAEADRSDAYNPEAAELAWERTLSFLNR